MVVKRANLSLFVQFNIQIGAQPTANLGEDSIAKRAIARGGGGSAEKPMEKNATALDGGGPAEKPKMKRAITLGGGGPAAGLHIGILEALEAHPEIEFQVWSLSCIGAWVGIVYNQFDGPNKAKHTHQFFKDYVLRDDESYERFPINSVSGPDWFGNTILMKYVSDTENYKKLWQPHKMMSALAETASLFSDPKKWEAGNFNSWILNQVLAPNPFVRNLASMMYLSDVNGLSKINYPESSLMKDIRFEKLFEPGMPLKAIAAYSSVDRKIAKENTEVRFINEKPDARQ